MKDVGNGSIHNGHEEKEIELEKIPSNPSKKQQKESDITQAEFEMYSLITDLTNIYTNLCEEMESKIDLKDMKNEEFAKMLADFDTTLSLNTVLTMEMMTAIRSLMGNNSEALQKLLTIVINNVNKTVEELDLEDLEPKFEEKKKRKIIYN